ncbi:MAG: hypothetical protein K6G61_08490 [Solobacterium sp.]|nr:hypothetical protein [Solobacterium sp.]
MKNTIKNIFIRILTVLMLVTVFTVPSVKQVSAATKGSSMSNPVVMTSGTTYQKKWTQNSKTLYTKFTVPARGVATFTINKPLEYDNEYGYYDIAILNSTGKELWKLSSYAMSSSSDKNAAYKIGLAKGTYFMEIKCIAYYSSSGRTSHTVNYNYKYTKTSVWEVEPNNTKKTATALTLGQTISGEYGEEDSDFSLKSHDYFKVKMTKGVSYRISIQGWKALNDTSWYGYIENSDGTKGYDLTNKSRSLVDGSFRYWDVTADATGTYYIHFYNRSNNKPIQYKLKVSKSPANTWKKINGYWLYFNSESKVTTGWKKIGKKWYHFTSGGVMETSTWVESGSKKSFVGPDGAMLTGWQKIDYEWYYLGSDGYAVSGWRKIGKKWYYFDSDCIMQHDKWITSGGKQYYLNSSGVMLTGWQKIFDSPTSNYYSWYYLGTDGVKRTGWQYIGGNWYYLGTEGRMVFGKDGIGGGYIDGKYYKFDQNGVCLNP